MRYLCLWFFFSILYSSLFFMDLLSRYRDVRFTRTYTQKMTSIFMSNFSLILYNNVLLYLRTQQFIGTPLSTQFYIYTVQHSPFKFLEVFINFVALARFACKGKVFHFLGVCVKNLCRVLHLN